MPQKPLLTLSSVRLFRSGNLKLLLTRRCSVVKPRSADRPAHGPGLAACCKPLPPYSSCHCRCRSVVISKRCLGSDIGRCRLCHTSFVRSGKAASSLKGLLLWTPQSKALQFCVQRQKLRYVSLTSGTQLKTDGQRPGAVSPAAADGVHPAEA